MRLADLHPIIATEIIEALESSGISTAEEILLTTDDELCRKLTNSHSIGQLQSLRQEVRQRLSAPGTRANELFANEQVNESQREKCYSGITSLDDLFDGFGIYGVIEIAGGKESGRTGLVINIVLRHMSSYPRHKTVWFDVQGEFDIERTHMIAGIHAGSTSLEAMLDNFAVITCFEVATIYEYLGDLEKSLRVELHDSRTRFVVVDSLTPLLAPLLSARPSQGHAAMTTLMRRLTFLARSFSLTILIINDAVQMTKDKASNRPLQPALGPSFTFLTDETLLLSAVDDLDQAQREESTITHQALYTAEILRSHNHVSKGRRCYFRMRNGVSLESCE